MRKFDWKKIDFKRIQFKNLNKGLLVILAAIVVVSAIVLINSNNKSEPEHDGKILGEETYVMSSEDDSYFDNARYTRKHYRDEAMSVFKSGLNDSNADSTARLAASESINEYARRSETETAPENQIKAKGFSECIVYVGEDNASVMVQSTGLSAEQAAQILDIVAAETKLNANVIKIIEVE